MIDYKALLDEALATSSVKITKAVIVQRSGHPVPDAKMVAGRDVDWDSFLNTGTSVKDAIPLKASDTSYVLYTSGTTGSPKGVVRDTGGQAVALRHAMQRIFGVNQGESWFAGSDMGWVVGHSFIVYGPLLNRNSTIIFEGKSVVPGNSAVYWRLLSEHKVVSFFTAPTALRAIKKEDPTLAGIAPFREGMKSLRSMFVAGERADPRHCRVGAEGRRRAGD